MLIKLGCRPKGCHVVAKGCRRNRGSVLLVDGRGLCVLGSGPHRDALCIGLVALRELSSFVSHNILCS